MQQLAPLEPNTLMRSFVSEVVHHSFHRAVKQIGLPPFSQQVFLIEISQALAGLDGRLPDDHASLVKLWRSIWHGEIIAAQVQEDTPVFYVRGGRRDLGVVMRLVCAHDQWRVDRVVSVYHRPLLEARWLSRTLLVGAIAAAVVVGFAGRNLTGELIAGRALPSATSQAVKAPTLLSPPQHATAAPASVPRARSQVSAHPYPARHTKAVQVRQRYTFTLSLGTPLYNLAQFLYDHKLVNSAIDFDMTMKQDGLNSDVQAGTYTFESGMTVNQIIHVLKRGPLS